MKRLFLLLFLFLGFADSALADYPATDNLYYYTAGNNTPTQDPDPAKACTNYAVYLYPSNGRGTVSGSAPNYTCTIYSGSSYQASGQLYHHYVCPYGGNIQLINGVQTCTGANPPPVCTKGPISAGMDLTSGWATGPDVGSALAVQVLPSGTFRPVATGGLANATYCSGGCQIQPNALPAAAYVEQTASSNGYYRVYLKSVPMSRNGATCTTDNSVAPTYAAGSNFPDATATTGSQAQPSTRNTVLDGSCPAGLVALGQDPSGMTICTSKTTSPPTSSSNTVTGPTTTTTNADGSTTTSQSVTTINSDGSTTTTVKQTTTASDGTVTVKTNSSTGNTPSGAQGQQDKPVDQSDLCKQHPELNVCKNSQVTGTCGQIQCTGDAIQCATLRAAAQLQCQQSSDIQALSSMPSTALGNSILAGADPMQGQIDANKAGTSVDVSNPGSNMDSSGFLGAGACLADRSFTVMNKVVTVKFSALCDKIAPLRSVILALAALVWIFIVAGALTGSGESSAVGG